MTKINSFIQIDTGRIKIFENYSYTETGDEICDDDANKALKMHLQLIKRKGTVHK